MCITQFHELLPKCFYKAVISCSLHYHKSTSVVVIPPKKSCSYLNIQFGGRLLSSYSRLACFCQFLSRTSNFVILCALTVFLSLIVIKFFTTPRLKLKLLFKMRCRSVPRSCLISRARLRVFPCPSLKSPRLCRRHRGRFPVFFVTGELKIPPARCFLVTTSTSRRIAALSNLYVGNTVQAPATVFIGDFYLLLKQLDYCVDAPATQERDFIAF